MITRIVVWGLLALIVGSSIGYYLGYNKGYTQAVSYFVAVK